MKSVLIAAPIAAPIAAMLALSFACTKDTVTTSKPTDAQPTSTASTASIGSIGSATMLADGTIVMSLRAEGAGGAVGDAQLTYPKTHKDYAKMLAHVGGLKPGESKPVPPFPAEK